jgi:hypothetical protein
VEPFGAALRHLGERACAAADELATVELELRELGRS